MSNLTITQLAEAISAHLSRFEADPKINAVDSHFGTKFYYHAGAFRAGRYVQVRYVAYQTNTNLTREEAEEYLAWLEAGNVGTHFSLMVEREKRIAKVLAKMRREDTEFITAQTLSDRAGVTPKDAAVAMLKAGFSMAQIGPYEEAS